jgi:hypothetical protein
MATSFILDTSKKSTTPIPQINARRGDWGVHDRYTFQLKNGGEVLTELEPGSLQFEGIAPGTFNLELPMYDKDGFLVHHDVYWEINEGIRTGRRTPGDAFHDSTEAEAIFLFGEGNYEISQEIKMSLTTEPRLIVDSTGFSDLDVSTGTFTYQFPGICFAVPGSFSQAYFSFTTTNGRATTVNFKITIDNCVDLTPPQALGYMSQYQELIDDAQALSLAITTNISDVLNTEDLVEIMECPDRIANLEDLMENLTLPDEYLQPEDMFSALNDLATNIFSIDTLQRINDGTFQVVDDSVSAFVFVQSRQEESSASETTPRTIATDNVAGYVPMRIINDQNTQVYINDNTEIYQLLTSNNVMVAGRNYTAQGIRIKKSGRYKVTATLGYENVTECQPNSIPGVEFEVITFRNIDNSISNLFRHKIGGFQGYTANMAGFSSSRQACGTAMLYDIQEDDFVFILKRGTASNGNLLTHAFSIEQV